MAASASSAKPGRRVAAGLGMLISTGDDPAITGEPPEEKTFPV
jgi:hypothetical protein